MWGRRCGERGGAIAVGTRGNVGGKNWEGRSSGWSGLGQGEEIRTPRIRPVG